MEFISALKYSGVKRRIRINPMNPGKRQHPTRAHKNRPAAAASVSGKPRSSGGPRFVDGYLPYLLARASHLISGEFHATLEKQRIPVMHWRVLCSLLEGPISVSELADIVIAKQPTMSKLLARMEKQGLIVRESDPADGRGVVVSTTLTGKRLVEPLVRLAKAHETSVLEPLGVAGANALVAVLSQLIRQHARSAAPRSARK
jgi:MarR family transcriptional regulator, organic hydroperoxide resistance regulator